MSDPFFPPLFQVLFYNVFLSYIYCTCDHVVCMSPSNLSFLWSSIIDQTWSGTVAYHTPCWSTSCSPPKADQCHFLCCTSGSANLIEAGRWWNQAKTPTLRLVSLWLDSNFPLVFFPSSSITNKLQHFFVLPNVPLPVSIYYSQPPLPTAPTSLQAEELSFEARLGCGWKIPSAKNNVTQGKWHISI